MLPFDVGDVVARAAKSVSEGNVGDDDSDPTRFLPVADDDDSNDIVERLDNLEAWSQTVLDSEAVKMMVADLQKDFAAQLKKVVEATQDTESDRQWRVSLLRMGYEPALVVGLKLGDIPGSASAPSLSASDLERLSKATRSGS